MGATRWPGNLVSYLKSDRKLRALITGITGFLGSHLIDHLQSCGDEVLGVARKASAGSERTASLNAVPHVEWDLASPLGPPDTTQQAIANFAPECVFHLAAMSVPRHCGNAEPTPAAWEINVGGTERLVACLRQLPNKPRLILASSGEVYARPTRNFLVAEDRPVEAHNGYAATKLAAERVVHTASDQGWLDGVIVRSFQHAGPGQNRELMMAEWARQVVDPNSDIVQVHSCEVWVDMSDVRDACRGYRLLALSGAAGETYNLGSGTSQRSGDILATMMRLAGSAKRVVECRPGRRRIPIADIGKLRSIVDWYPRIPVAQTITDTLAWWRAHAGTDARQER